MVSGKKLRVFRSERYLFEYMKFLWAVILAAPLFFAPGTHAWGGTALGDLAASLQPGTLQELTTNGLTAELLQDPGGNNESIGYWAYRIHWDPVTKRLLFSNGSHGSTVGKLIQYDDATNTWSLLCRLDQCSSTYGGVNVGGGHEWYGHALNPTARKYYKRFGDYAWDIDNGGWTAQPGPFSSLGCSYCEGYGSMEYFPERNSILMISMKGNTWMEKNLSNNTWNYLSTSGMPSAQQMPTILYNPYAKEVFAGGGGSSSTFILNSSGVTRAGANAPISMDDHVGQGAADPQSRDWVFVDTASSTRTMWAYTSVAGGAGRWRQLPTPAGLATMSSHIPSGGNGLTVGYIDTYGVIVFLTADAHLYIYKHSNKDVVPPIPPSGFWIQ